MIDLGLLLFGFRYRNFEILKPVLFDVLKKKSSSLIVSFESSVRQSVDSCEVLVVSVHGFYSFVLSNCVGIRAK